MKYVCGIKVSFLNFFVFETKRQISEINLLFRKLSIKVTFFNDF